MDVRQLDALVAVADHRTFSAAARALHTVQSNVSTRIARLENELGVTLVDRSAGRLTSVGEIVVARARRVRAELDAVVSDVGSLSAEVSGTVRLGLIGTTGRWLTSHLLGTMGEHHPGIWLVLVEATTAGLVPQLRAGLVDLAIVNAPLDDPELELEPLFTETLVLLTPTDHPLAIREELHITDLAIHPVMAGPPGNAMRAIVDRELGGYDLRLRVLAEVDGVRLTVSLVEDGVGPAIVPATAAAVASPERTVAIPIADIPVRQVGTARRRGSFPSSASRATEALVTELLHRDDLRPAGIEPRRPVPGVPDATLGDA